MFNTEIVLQSPGIPQADFMISQALSDAITNLPYHLFVTPRVSKSLMLHLHTHTHNRSTNFNREKKVRTNFCCTNFLHTPRGPGHPGKIPGTSQIPFFETPGRQTFKGGHELFGHHSFAWKTTTPPAGLRTQKVDLCALFSCLILVDTVLWRLGLQPP